MQILDFILCDDIRDEAQNKVSLMGIYNSRINVRTADKSTLKFPIIMPMLGIYVRLESNDMELVNCRLVVYKGETKVFEHSGIINKVRLGDPYIMKWRISPFLIEEAEFKFSVFLQPKDSQEEIEVEPYSLTVGVEEIKRA